MTIQCDDNTKDRETGAHWERQFSVMAGDRGYLFTAHQIGRTTSAAAHRREGKDWAVLTLPDITIWSAPGQHHEIKHKSPDRSGCYGLESYRLRALHAFHVETGQAVFYTIHDWSLAGAMSSTESVPNQLGDWVTADVRDLYGRYTDTRQGTSWYAGKRRDNVTVHYWRVQRFQPLADVWAALREAG